MDKIIRTLFVFLLSLTLLGCQPKINEATYQRIANNMTYKEVVNILGNPTDTAVLKLGDFSTVTGTWEDKSGKIVIQFVNDKVRMKNFSGNGVEKFELK